MARRKAVPNMVNLVMHGKTITIVNLQLIINDLKQSLLLTYKLIINDLQQQEYIKDKQRRKRQSKHSQQTQRIYAVLGD